MFQPFRYSLKVKFMTACQRCNTENLEGSQYCERVRSSARARRTFRNLLNTGVPAPVTDESNNGVSSSLLESQSCWIYRQRNPDAAKDGRRALVATASRAKLVIERGRSAGKQFLLNEKNRKLGRWDADGGIFPDVDWMQTTLKQRFHGGTPGSFCAGTSILLKIWDLQTARYQPRKTAVAG